VFNDRSVGIGRADNGLLMVDAKAFIEAVIADIMASVPEEGVLSRDNVIEGLRGYLRHIESIDETQLRDETE
jgi:hypothetical protein